jgi:hypothetical protein
MTSPGCLADRDRRACGCIFRDYTRKLGPLTSDGGKASRIESLPGCGPGCAPSRCESAGPRTCADPGNPRRLRARARPLTEPLSRRVAHSERDGPAAYRRTGPTDRVEMSRQIGPTSTLHLRLSAICLAAGPAGGSASGLPPSACKGALPRRREEPSPSCLLSPREHFRINGRQESHGVRL